MNTDRRAVLTRALKMATMGFGVAVLSGCGFRPVYGTGSADGGVNVDQDLAAIKLGVIEGRPGQILHNHLLDRFNPKGQPVKSLYVLTTEVKTSSSELGTQIDATTTRSQVSVLANARLSAFGETIPFVSRAVASFSTAQSDYASKVAEEEAIERSMRVIADDLRLQIATFFEKRRLVQGG